MARMNFLQLNKKRLPQIAIPVAALILGAVFLMAGASVGTKAKQSKASSKTPPSVHAASLFSAPNAISPGVLLIKFKENPVVAKGASRTSISSVDVLLDQYNAYSIEPAFPFLRYSNKKMADELRRIYYVKISKPEQLGSACDAFAEDENIEFAEPQIRFKLTATPNDPQVNQQQVQLDLLNLPAAWDIVKADTSDVVIAIVDGGTEWDHDDLEANIWINEDEIPDNNIDDDNNGFIDDIRGWNFANESNDPRGLAGQTVNRTHGTRTAGIAGAVTNNALGIAGTSWNAKLMAINAAAEEDTVDQSIAFGYAGIVYAADNGADIVNVSWGGDFEDDFPFTALLQDVIDFAHANGTLVVVAAGNSGDNNDNTLRLPSNLQHVLSVGSISNTSTKSSFSNYGTKVHVYAPGESVLSTHADNRYGFQQGTSFSTPYAAGVAALVKALHPDWTPDQVREQVRVTSTSIDNLNPGYGGLLGKGKIDALRAVTETTLPSLRFAGVSFEGAGDNGTIDPGETIDLNVKVTNFLAPVSNVSVSMASRVANISMISNQATIASISTNDTVTVTFQLQAQSAIAEDQLLSFYLNFIASNYADRDIFEFNPRPPQILSHNTGPLQATITSKGTIGFLTNAADSNGIGVVLNNFNYLFEGGLMIGTGLTSVSNSVRGVNIDQDDDFRLASGSFLKIDTPGTLADQQGTVTIVDSLSSSPLGLKIKQETISYNTPPFNQFIIFKYTVFNIGPRSLPTVNIGLFFDWDLNSDAMDFARFDENRSLGTVQNRATNPDKLIATKVLSELGVTSYHVVDNRNEIDLPVSDPTQNGFTNAEKWIFMNDGIQVTTRSSTDVSTVSACGPYEIFPGDSVVVAFAIVAAETQAELYNSADAAQYVWENNYSTSVVNKKPNISTAILQNPAASKYADFVLITDRSLETVPSVDLTVGGNTSSLSMRRVIGLNNMYKGAIEFSSEGAYTVTTRATAVLTGADSTESRTYQVALAKPGTRTKVAVNGGEAVLSLSKNSVNAETYIFGSAAHNSERETIYTFSPGTRIEEPAELELHFDASRYAEPGKLFIYRQFGDSWQVLASRVDTESSTIRADADKLGSFKLVYDGLYAGDNTLPVTFALRQNYPNPFNPSTAIEYDLPEAGKVTLIVYNQLGQVVKTLVQTEQSAGRYRVSWNGRSEDGREVSSGIYFYQLKTETFSQTNKMILLQ